MKDLHELDRQRFLRHHAAMPMQLRAASEGDAGTIYRFILDLARYEKEPDAVHTSESVLRRQLRSERPPFECIIAEWDSVPCGFALYFYNYSTWRGSSGIYLEDLYVAPEFRGRQVGQSLLRKLASLTLDRGGHRLEWSVLDWNKPAIRFYEQLGAEPLNDWTTWRLTGSALEKLVEEK